MGDAYAVGTVNQLFLYLDHIFTQAISDSAVQRTLLLEYAHALGTWAQWQHEAASETVGNELLALYRLYKRAVMIYSHALAIPGTHARWTSKSKAKSKAKAKATQTQTKSHPKPQPHTQAIAHESMATEASASAHIGNTRLSSELDEEPPRTEDVISPVRRSMLTVVGAVPSPWHLLPCGVDHRGLPTTPSGVPIPRRVGQTAPPASPHKKRPPGQLQTLKAAGDKPQERVRPETEPDGGVRAKANTDLGNDDNDDNDGTDDGGDVSLGASSGSSFLGSFHEADKVGLGQLSASLLSETSFITSDTANGPFRSRSAPVMAKDTLPSHTACDDDEGEHTRHGRASVGGEGSPATKESRRSRMRSGAVARRKGGRHGSRRRRKKKARGLPARDNGAETVIHTEKQAEMIRFYLGKWAECIDGMVSLRKQCVALDSRDPFKERLLPLVDHFMQMHALHSLVDPQLSLRPVLALALASDKDVRRAALEALRQLSVHGSGDIQRNAQRNLDFSHVIASAEWTDQLAWCQLQVNGLDPRVRLKLEQAGLSLAHVTRHWSVLRQILHFEYGTRLPLPFARTATKAQNLSAERRRATEYRMLARKLQKANEFMFREEFENSIIHANPQLDYIHWEVVGTGAFGDVFSAKVKGMADQQVAIKSVKAESRSDFALVKREILTMMACDHHNLLTYHKAYDWEERLWVVMEFCDGGTLREFCVSNTLTEPLVAYICREVLSGLAYLHEMPRIHRDIKPENILLLLSGDVKVGDLGLTIEYKPDTLKTSMAGTPYYMAPEMVQGKGYSPKLDLWSFGCLVLELCNGRPPYYRQGTLSVLFQIGTCTPQQVPTLDNRKPWSPQLRNFLDCCLQVDPSQRLTAKDLLHHPFLTRAEDKAVVKKLFGYVFAGRMLKAAGLY